MQRAMSSTDTQRRLIRNGFLYCADLDNTVIENAWVLIVDKHIQAIGPMSEPLPEYDAVIEAAGKMILPGFVNPHWHESFVAPNPESPRESGLCPTPYAGGGNISDLGSMFGFIAGVGQKLTFDEGLAIARWSLWTQLRSGTTALGDVGSANSADAMATAALDLGMRLRVSRWGSDSMIDGGGGVVTVANLQEQTDGWLDLLEKWHQHPSGLVGGMPSVMGAFGSSDAQLMALAEVAKRFDVPYATHLAALKNERAAVTKAFGFSSVERFARMGLLTPQLLAVHTAYTTQEELQQLLAAGVNLCHAPAHYGMLGEKTNSETQQFGRLLQEGVWLSSSTDGDITYTGGMCEAMRGAHLQHNEVMNCNTTCPPSLALKTGSLFGAKALGWLNKIGSIEPGKEADIVMVPVSDFRYKQSLHPLRTFLVAASSADIDTVIVQGQIVVQNGRSVRFDEAELYEDYLRAAASARHRIGQPIPQKGRN